MICPSCGNQCNDDIQFCSYCGYRFSAEPAQNPVPPVAPQPVAQNTAPVYGANYGYTPPAYAAQPVSPAPQRNSNTVLVLGIVATCINAGLGCLCGCLGMLPGLICAIIGMVFGFKNRKTYMPGEKDSKNDVGLILCFVALGLLLVITVVNFVMGALGYMGEYGF